MFGLNQIKRRLQARGTLRCATRRCPRQRLSLERLEARKLLTTVYGDFNNDGFDDLVAGVPGEDISSVTDAGAVNVLYGSSSGLRSNSSPNDQIWHQNAGLTGSSAEAGDQFGGALAVGDFDDDGYDDLAVGVPGEDIGSVTDAGAINIIYGSSTGLTTSNNQFWHQGRSDAFGTVNGVYEAGDHFGAELTVGDFNSDGIDDLAIAAPGEAIGSRANAGAVNVLYGKNNVGLTTQNDQIWHQNKGLAGVAETGDLFGSAIAAGDFDGDGTDDLAVGVSGEDVGSITDAGAINIIYGSGSGLTTAGNHTFHQNKGLAGAAEPFDRFGSSLAAGDFNRAVILVNGQPVGIEGYDDLAVGVPGEDIGSIPDAGAVNVIYGSSSGLATANNQLWHQNKSDSSGSINGSSDAFDHYGAAVAAGDFDGDVRDDLAVGVPGEDVGNMTDAGVVNVLYGSFSGLTADGDETWHQNSGLNGSSEVGDRFGSTLGVGHFNSGNHADLVVGVPLEDIGSRADAGAINVIYGSVSGLTANGNQLWHQNRPSVKGVAEEDDRFGGGGLFTPGLVVSTTATDILQDAAEDATVGAYLKEVSGRVLAESEQITTFYPASMVKVVYHVHAMQQVEQGNITLDTIVPIFTSWCSTPSFDYFATLETMLSLMIVNSNNDATNSVANLFGQSNIEATGHALGMNDLQLTKPAFGCGDASGNALTLKDTGTLYGKAVNGQAGITGANLDKFHELMINSIWGSLQDVVLEETAAKLGKDTNDSDVQSLANNFIAAMSGARKSGSYTSGGKFYRTTGGRVSLPFVQGDSTIQQQHYVFGIFVDQADSGDKDAVNSVIGEAAAEVFRDAVRTALQTW